MRGLTDCAIAALSTYLRVDYEEVVIAAERLYPAAWRNGLDGVQIAAVATELGFTGRWLRRYDLSEATGILDLRERASRHVVVVLDGWIFELGHNPVTVWEPELYCQFFRAKPRNLFVVDDRAVIPPGIAA